MALGVLNVRRATSDAERVCEHKQTHALPSLIPSAHPQSWSSRPHLLASLAVAGLLHLWQGDAFTWQQPWQRPWPYRQRASHPWPYLPSACSSRARGQKETRGTERESELATRLTGLSPNGAHTHHRALPPRRVSCLPLVPSIPEQRRTASSQRSRSGQISEAWWEWRDV